MQDLLNEKEFLQKPYNPWKLFYVFYAIAFIQLLLFIAVSLVFVTEAGTKSLMAAILLPDITALTMFFYKKKNAQLQIKTIALATLVLFGIYYVPAIVLSIATGANLIGIAFIAGLGTANFLLCFVIMYLVARSKQKNGITHQ